MFLGYPTYQFIKGDIRDKYVVEEAMRDIDHVVHLAAIVGEPAARKFHEDAKSINNTGTEIVFESALRHNIERFVFSLLAAVTEYRTLVLWQLKQQNLILYHYMRKQKLKWKIILKIIFQKKCHILL